ncbi:MAG TPA: HD domain-containing phosphohydrolase [Burkholderiaceae bacterium]|nr:HD domain-containing phosphohydrolase [Burkholderiaceae bacterium]
MESAQARLQQFAARAATASREEAELFFEQLQSALLAALARPAGNGSALFTDALAALERVPRQFVTPARVECLLAIAQHLYLTGQPLAAVVPAKEASDFARQTSDAALLRKALTFEGIVLADSGNLPGAIESYATALEIASELKEVRAEASVWLNLGGALIYAGQYHDGVACMDRVIALANEYSSLEFMRGPAFTNIALACLYLEDLGKGLRAAKAATDLLNEPKTATELHHRVLAETHYTRLLIEAQGLQQAKERCELAKRYAKESRSERNELMAALAEGLYEVHAGMVDVGLSRLTQALERARILKSMLRDALIAMVKAHEVAGKPDVALVYLRELMLHTKKIQQDNALHHHRLHLERLERRQAEQTSGAEHLMERREQSLRGKLAEQVAQQELLRARIELLERLAVTAELRDDATGEHSYRVGRLAALLAHEFGCDEQTCFMIDLAARLHDIGKIGIPDGILLKPDRLSNAERQIMQTHTTVGAELLAKSDVPHLQMAEEIARFHHEWWNGSGYPFGIGGTAIPVAARITALADVFDALTHRRPYKEAWPVARALEEIARLRGEQFDPHLADLFLALIPRLQREVGDLDEYLAQAARQSPFIQARQKISATLRQFSHGRFDDQR